MNYIELLTQEETREEGFRVFFGCGTREDFRIANISNRCQK